MSILMEDFILGDEDVGELAMSCLLAVPHGSLLYAGECPFDMGGKFMFCATRLECGCIEDEP